MACSGDNFTFRNLILRGRGPLSLVSTTEELLGRNINDFNLETREYGVGICHSDHVTPY
jgi:hypothetical protein